MKVKFAFSLAEALITLLIVCIIAVVSAPMITKKAKKSMRTEFWQKDSYVDSAVSVRNGFDVRFGTAAEDKKNQGIVVVGTLYFKDKNGKVIGWISEDGKSSFASECQCSAPAVSSVAAGVDADTINQLMRMVQNLYGILEQQKGAGAYSQVQTVPQKRTGRASSQNRSYNSKADVRSQSSSNTYGYSQNSLPAGSMNIDPNQMQALQNMDPAELQGMMKQIMQMFPMQ